MFSKTIAELRDIARGEPITARMLNEPRRAINTMLRGATPPRQILTLPRPGDAEPAITVVLVEAPSLPDPPEEPGSSILKVRRVAYADPPVPEEYEWDGEAFDAYPAFGLKIADFVGLEWLSQDAPEFARALFLKARLINDFWLVDWPVPITAQFKFEQLSTVDDFIIVNTWDGVRRGRGEVIVALPYELRKTPFHGRTRANVRYTYVSAIRRIATQSGVGTEKQIVIPTFVSGDIIYATRPIRGGMDVTFPNPTPIWLDDNRAGRAWALEFEEPTSA